MFKSLNSHVHHECVCVCVLISQYFKSRLHQIKLIDDYRYTIYLESIAVIILGNKFRFEMKYTNNSWTTTKTIASNYSHIYGTFSLFLSLFLTLTQSLSHNVFRSFCVEEKSLFRLGFHFHFLVLVLFLFSFFLFTKMFVDGFLARGFSAIIG